MKSSSRQEDLLKKVARLERKLMEAKEGEERLLEDLGNTVLNALLPTWHSWMTRERSSGRTSSGGNSARPTRSGAPRTRSA